MLYRVGTRHFIHICMYRALFLSLLDGSVFTKVGTAAADGLWSIDLGSVPTSPRHLLINDHRRNNATVAGRILYTPHIYIYFTSSDFLVCPVDIVTRSSMDFSTLIIQK